MTTEYRTNPHLDTENAQDDSMALLDYSATLAYETETTRLAAAGIVSATRFLKNSEYDNDRLNLTLSAAHETETGLTLGELGTTRDNTLTSELETTGFVQTPIDRTNNFLAASHSMQLTETLAARADYSLTSVEYEKGRNTPLVDYRYQVISLNLSGEYSDSIGWSVRGSYSDFEAADTDYRSKTSTLGPSLSVQLDEKTKVSGSLGYSSTEIDSSSVSPDNRNKNSLNFAFSLSRDFEDFSMMISAKRLEQPTGSGYVQTTENLAAVFRKEISPQWTADLELGASRNSLDETGTSDEHRQLLSLVASTGYRVTQDLSIKGYYRVRNQQYTHSDTSATSHAVGLALSYSWPE
jgi:outer membrane protein assembly factor BamA